MSAKRTETIMAVSSASRKVMKKTRQVSVGSETRDVAIMAMSYSGARSNPPCWSCYVERSYERRRGKKSDSSMSTFTTTSYDALAEESLNGHASVFELF